MERTGSLEYVVFPLIRYMAKPRPSPSKMLIIGFNLYEKVTTVSQIIIEIGAETIIKLESKYS